MKYAKVACVSLILITFTWACKKDIPADNDSSGISPTDIVALSQKIKIDHGQKIEAVMPSPSGNGLVLDTESNNKTTYGIVGKYAIIEPQVSEGEVAGYYLRIVGDDKNHFKIDYSRPISGRKKIGTSNSKKIGLFKRMMDNNPDYTDSVIIIRLPDNISPGIICVEYSAYDQNGNVSNVIKECINISPLGNDKNLVGNWEAVRYKKLNGEWAYFPDSLLSMEWYYDAYCLNNKLYLQEPIEFGNATPIPNLLTEVFLESDNMVFLENGTVLIQQDDVFSDINFEESTCEKFIYDIVDTHKHSDTAYWALDTTTQYLIFLGADNSDDMWIGGYRFQYLDKDRFEIKLFMDENATIYESQMEYKRQ